MSVFTRASAWWSVVLAACVAGCSLIGPVHERSATATAAHVQGSRVEVETVNGSVKLAAISSDQVMVAATFRSPSQERVARMSVSLTRTPEGVLRIQAVPADGQWQNSEGCSLVIGVPSADGAKVRTSNGAIEIAGLSGAADLDTSNGAVIVLRQAGAVTARSSNGSIRVDGAGGPVDASSSNGSIDVALSPEVAGPVTLRSSNGAVTLSVGAGFAGTLSLATSNGRINVPTGPGISSAGVTKSRGEVSFGTGGAPSLVETSNGGITVQVTK